MSCFFTTLVSVFKSKETLGDLIGVLKSGFSCSTFAIFIGVIRSNLKFEF